MKHKSISTYNEKRINDKIIVCYKDIEAYILVLCMNVRVCINILFVHIPQTVHEKVAMSYQR